MSGWEQTLIGLGVIAIWSVIVFVSFRIGRTRPLRREMKQKHLGGTSNYKGRFALYIARVEKSGRKATVTGTLSGAQPDRGDVVYLDKKDGERCAVYVTKVTVEAPASEDAPRIARVTVSEFGKFDIQNAYGLTNMRDQRNIETPEAAHYVRYPVLVKKPFKETFNSWLVMIIGISALFMSAVGFITEGVSRFSLFFTALGLFFLSFGVWMVLSDLRLLVTIEQSGSITIRKLGKTIDRKVDDLFYNTRIAVENGKEKRVLTIFDTDRKPVCEIGDKCTNFTDLWTVFAQSYEKRREALNAAEGDND